MMKTLATLFFLIVFSAAQAQLRDPTTQEKTALDKISVALISTLDQFNSDDWDKINDYYSPLSVNPNPGVPIDIDNNFERQYRVRLN
jgi:hypothetical protein